MNKEHLQQTVKDHLKHLYEEHTDAVGNSRLISCSRLNQDTRYAVWPGQSPDGRKWVPKEAGAAIFPWRGAADSRVMLADEQIRTDTAILMSIFWRMRTIVNATEANDAKQSTQLTQFLRWQKYTQIPGIWREAKLMANWLMEQGKVVAGIFWERRLQTGRESLDKELLLMAAMDSGLDPNDIITETGRDAFGQLVQQLYPSVKLDAAIRAVDDIVRDGYADILIRTATRNCPRVVALEPGVDFFVSTGTDDIQDARCCLRREVISESVLREREHTFGWKKSWITRVVETQRGARAVRSDGKLLDDDEHSKYYEVWHAFRTLSDADGVPGIYYTVYVPGLLSNKRDPKTEEVGFHDLLNYKHGLKPFVYIERETTKRSLMESRGVGEVVATWQDTIKTEWDAQRDRASITTRPPNYYPRGEPAPHWGPGASIGVDYGSKEYGFFDVPNFDRGSSDVIDMVTNAANRYFGRRLPDGSNGVQSQVLTEDLAINWMRGWIDIDTQILKLDQQWMPEEIYYRVIGARQAPSIKIAREDIQGNFDVQIGFAAQTLNPEMWEQWMRLIEILTQHDPQGKLDYTEVQQFICELVDPNLADRFLKDDQQITLDEVEDERQALTQILNGFDVPIKPGAQAHEMRLGIIEQSIQANPRLAKIWSGEAEPEIKQLLEKRIQQHQHQLVQRQNAVIGKLGA